MPENLPATQPADLAASTLNALRWSYGGRIVQAACQLLIGVWLARILGPEPFGLVAAAWLIVGLASQWADLGLSAALTQRQSVTANEVRYTFTVQLLLGAGLTLVTAAAAGPVAAILRNPDLTWIIRALSLIFVFQVAGSVSASLLKRRLNFRAIQISQVASYIICYLLIGVPLAFRGLGAWTLVAAQIAQSLVNSLLLYVQSPFPPKLSLRARPEGLLGFGSRAAGTNLVNWIIASADTAALAKAYGMSDLGLYNRANALTTLPTASFLSALSAVLFPACSRARDPETMRRLYLASVASVSLVAFPLFLGIAIAHETVVQGILGTAWSPAGPLLVPLALSMLPYSVMILAGPIIWARARVGLELRVQIVVAVFFVLILIVTAPISFTAVAWGVLAMNCVRAYLLTRQALRTIDVSWRRLASALHGALVLASCTAPFIWASDVIIAQDAATPVGLAANLIAGIVAGTAAVFLFPEAVFGTEFAWLVGRYGDRMPTPLRNLFRHIRSAGEEAS